LGDAGGVLQRVPVARSKAGSYQGEAEMGTLGMILSVVGGIGALIFTIQILIIAFKTSLAWGQCSLLTPFVILVYIAKNWEACKTPFLRSLVCMVIAVIGSSLSMYGAFSGAMAQ
jgi:hypothetical protein